MHCPYMVDNNSHMEVRLPLAFDQGNGICHYDCAYTLKDPISHQQMLMELKPVHLSKLREKEHTNYCSCFQIAT